MDNCGEATAADGRQDLRWKLGKEGGMLRAKYSAVGIQRGAGQWATLQEEREQARRGFRGSDRLLLKAVPVSERTDAGLENQQVSIHGRRALGYWR